jgi:WD40 repeat protein
MNEIISNYQLISNYWLDFVLHNIGSATWIAIVVLIVSRFAKPIPSKIRYGILVFALIKFIVPPVSLFTIDFTHSIGENELIPIDHPYSPDMSMLQETLKPLPPVVELNEYTNPSNQPIEESFIAKEEAFDSKSNLPAMQWLDVLFMFYSVGLLLIVTCLGFQYRKLYHLRKHANHQTKGNLFERFSRLRDELGVRHSLQLLVSDNISTPITFGIFYPAIMLPREMVKTLSSQELDHVLAHELIHQVRYDLWINSIQIAVTVLWWFHPLVWFVNREICRARENSCDDYLLSKKMVTNQEYCNTLFKAYQLIRSNKLAYVSLGLAERYSDMYNRIQRIMDSSYSRTTRFPVLFMSFLLCGMLLIIPSLQFGIAKEVDTQSINTITSLKHENDTLLGLGTLTHAAVSEDGKILVTSGGRGSFIWQLSDHDAKLIRWIPSEEVEITSIALSPNKKILARGNEIGQVELWDLETFQCTTQLQVNDLKTPEMPNVEGLNRIQMIRMGIRRNRQVNHITHVIFSPDGSYFMTGEGNGKVKLWNTASLKQRYSINVFSRSIGTLSFSPSGNEFVITLSGYQNKVLLFQTKSGDSINELIHERSVNWADFSGNGKKLYVSFQFSRPLENASLSDFAVWIEDKQKKQTLDSIIEDTDDTHLKLLGHRREVYCIDTSIDGQFAITGSGDGTAKIWDLTNNKLIETIGSYAQSVNEPTRLDSAYRVFLTKFIPNTNRVLIVNRQGHIIIYDRIQKKEIFRLPGYNSSLYEYDLSKDRKYLALGSYDGTVHLQNTETGKIERTYGQHNDYIIDLSFSPDETKIVSCDRIGNVNLWARETGELLHTFGESDDLWYGCSVFSPDGKYLVCGNSYYTDWNHFRVDWYDTQTGELAKTWKRRSLQLEKEFTQSDNSRFTNSIWFTPDEQYCISAAWGSIEIRNWITDKTISENRYENIWDPVFSPDSSIMVSGHDELIFYNYPEGTIQHKIEREKQTKYSIPNIKTKAFSSNGKWIAIGERFGKVAILDSEDYSTIYTFNLIDTVNFLSFSPDNKQLLIGTINGARIRDLPDLDNVKKKTN